MQQQCTTVPLDGPQTSGTARTHPRPGGPVPHDPRAFLDHFAPEQRSTIANWFHYAVRSGATTPHTVCSAVWQGIQHRLQWSTIPEKRTFLSQAMEVLQSDQTGALEYGASVLAYEQLPYHERQRVKGHRALAYAMQGKEVTPAQLNYLHALGYREAPPVDRAAASALIDQLRQGKGRP